MAWRWLLHKASQLLLDLTVLILALWLSFVIRFEGTVAPRYSGGLTGTLWGVAVLQYLCLMAAGVPNLSWRYVSLFEAQRICLALSAASAILMLGLSYSHNELLFAEAIPDIPRGVIAIDLFLSVLGILGVRVFTRIWHERGRKSPARSISAPVPTLLIGAGRAGSGVVKEITANTGIRPIGFLDDDADKMGLSIHGVRVLGKIDDLVRIAREHHARQALVTIGDPSPETLRRILSLCRDCGIAAKVIPGIRGLIQGRGGWNGVRDVAIEDLLRRAPVSLDLEAIAGFVNHRKILITGAGGSIGSELCRTVCRFAPESLVLVEHTENSLFHIEAELTRDFPGTRIIPCIADVCDVQRMRGLFDWFRPNMVLHAAAHKHVPLMEHNPGEAIKNNVLGTRAVADLADEYGVDEFVMISTDKAVNPTSVMGVSKRIAEIYIQALSERSKTRFVAVRFGNVLGSAGSVIPTFKQQIARGGPVTITHPDMKRYFMTVPEACQLVLQAATMGQGGEIFILDMGEPVRIIDLAQDLIRLSGFSPDDIPIKITGMRPGEKLFEELSLADEVARKTRHPKIFVGRLRSVDWDTINGNLRDLQELVDCSHLSTILEKLKEIVPEYHTPAATGESHTRLDTEHALPGPKNEQTPDCAERLLAQA